MGLSKEKGKLLERLRSSRLRPREGLFLVEGARGVREVLDATLPLEVRFALVSPRLGQAPGGNGLASRISDSGIPVVELSDAEMAGISETEASQGVMLVAAEPRDPMEAVDAQASPRVLLLDGVQDPGNAGTLIRTARAFGLDGVLALDGTVDPWNSKAVRAAAGAFAHLPVARLPWGRAWEWLQKRNIPLVAADAEGEDVRGVPPSGSWALAVGNEGAGPRNELLNKAERVVSIPMAPGVESLNAGVAGAILLYALTSGGIEDRTKRTED